VIGDPQPAVESSDRGRSSGLDGLRAFAALFVVAFHLHTVSGLSFGPLDPIVRGGDSGVTLFFALSGYLLYRPFVRGTVDLAGYGLKRAGRILPGYYVALTGLLVVTGSRLPIEHPLPFLTMSASYDIPLRAFLGNAWTLSAELLFYLTLPLIARAARGREVAVITGLGLGSALLAIWQRLNFSADSVWLSGAYPFVFHAFVPGMLLAFVEIRRPSTFAWLRRWPYLVLGWTLIVVGALTTILPVALATGVGTVLLMGWLSHHPLPGARVLAFAGGASYSLYLWHKDTIIEFGPVAGVAIALVACGLSWYLIERPVLAWAHAASARRRGILPAQPAAASAN
jgi:peptidoglycan/LPS O-acetylase OafA/YrhL